MSQLHEECGVFGVLAPEKGDVASTVYYGLFALQHRGQESCGIVVNDDGIFTAHKDTGLVNDVFTPMEMEKLGQGDMAIGHVRYGTTGSASRANAQPIVVNHVKGPMALCHNGNLINSYDLREDWSWEAPFSTPPPTPRSFPTSSPRNASPPPPLRRRFAAP